MCYSLSSWTNIGFTLIFSHKLDKAYFEPIICGGQVTVVLSTLLYDVHFSFQKLEEDKNKVLGELKESQEECEGIKKEQEDLLVLLADQDTKIANYKDRLCTLGEKVGFFMNFNHLIGHITK